VALQQEVFAKPVHDDVELLLDIITPLDELMLDIRFSRP
jgi:hypothetical protein